MYITKLWSIYITTYKRNAFSSPLPNPKLKPKKRKENCLVMYSTYVLVQYNYIQGLVSKSIDWVLLIKRVHYTRIPF